MENIVDKAKQLFGITHNPTEAGYILPDGTMLDLSGRHQVEHDYIRDSSNKNVPKKAGKPDYFANKRFVDHREINDLYDLNSGTEAMRKFMVEAPALRFQPGIGFDVSAVPTPIQLAKALQAHFSFFSDPILVDVTDPKTGHTISSRDFSRRDIGAIMDYISKALGGTHKIAEGKSLVLGDTGRRVIQSPSRSDIIQMLQKSAMLRGTAIASPDNKDFEVFVWPGRSFSHWTATNELGKMGFFGDFQKTFRLFDFKLAATPEKIKEDRYWRDAEIYDCDGYYAAFSFSRGKNKLEWITDSPYLHRLFPVNKQYS